MTENTIPASTRLTTEELTAIEMSGEKPSKFLRDAVIEKLESENWAFINKKIQVLKEKLVLLEQKKEIIKEKEKEKSNIPKGEIEFLIETKKILEQSPHFVKGRINLYINNFAKTYKISETEFFALLEAAEIQFKEKEILKEVKKTK